MSEGFELNSTNIDRAIKQMKAQIDSVPHYAPSTILMPVSIRTNEINRKSYKGRGRPRNEDYVRVPTMDILKNTAFFNEKKRV